MPNWLYYILIYVLFSICTNVVWFYIVEVRGMDLKFKSSVEKLFIIPFLSQAVLYNLIKGEVSDFWLYTIITIWTIISLPMNILLFAICVLGIVLYKIFDIIIKMIQNLRGV